MTQTQPSHLNLKQRNLMIAVMMIGAFIGVLNQTLLTTILPEVMKDFAISSSTAQWLTTIFMLVNGIMIPVTAYLIERFSLRTLFFTAATCLILGSLICMLGVTFPLLLVGRSIQALGAGILMPLSQTLLFIIFPVENVVWQWVSSALSSALHLRLVLQQQVGSSTYSIGAIYFSRALN